MRKEQAKMRAARYLEWADKAEARAKEIQAAWDRDYGAFDWTQPILVGHHSERAHRRVFERRNSTMRSIIDLEAKAKRFREKASNLTAFANRNKGDAENARMNKRALADTIFSVGSDVFDWSYREGRILKVNKNTYTIQFKSGAVIARDKSYFV